MPAILKRKRTICSENKPAAIPAGVIALKKSSAQLMEDIDSAFQSEDVIIACSSQSGFAKTKASALLLSVTSRVLKSLFDNVAQSCDEAPYIILPDFDLSDVNGLLGFMRKGYQVCLTVSRYSRLKDLADLLEVDQAPPTTRHLQADPPKQVCPQPLVTPVSSVSPKPRAKKKKMTAHEEIEVMPDVKLEPLDDGITYLVSMPGCFPPDDDMTDGKVVAKIEGQFSCEVCGERFLTNSVLARHLKEAHMTFIKYQCVKCDKTFPSEISIDRHLIQHSEDRFYECSLCGENFKNHTAVDCHRRKDHDGVECATVFKTDSEAFQLLRQSLVKRVIVQKDNTVCPECGWECTNGIQGWLDHLEGLLPDDYCAKREIREIKTTQYGAVQCPVCNTNKKDMAYLTSHMMEHMREAHQRVTFCKQCNKTFDSVTSYFQHLETHKK